MRRKTYFRYAVVVLLFLIQALFLLAIFHENKGSYLLMIITAAILLLVWYTYRKSAIHSHKQEYESLKVAAWVPVGAVCSYYLNEEVGLGPVLGAAITGTLASFVPEWKRSSVYLKQLPAALYCGAFVGMSSARVANGFLFIVTAGIVTAVLLVVSKSLLNGIGGRLGTLAFAGVALTYLLIVILR